MEKMDGQKLGRERLVTFDESLELAGRILERHKLELDAMLVTDNIPEEDRPAAMFGKSAIQYHINKLSDEVKSRFVGHGIYRRNLQGNLATFINVLQNLSLVGDAAPLSGSGYYNAVTNKDFLILSHIDKPLPVYPENIEPNSGKSAVRNEVGVVINPGAFVLNTPLYPIVDELRKMFPDRNIIKASEIGDFVNNELLNP